MIGKINPPSSKGHQFILAITDYFTKWVEAVPIKLVTSRDVINFVKEHVIHRFGIPQTITTDGGSVFISVEFKKFTADMGIKLIRSSPYYAAHISDMGQQELHHIIWYMGRRPYCHGKLRPVQDE
jgi:hypothetical protein